MDGKVYVKNGKEYQRPTSMLDHFWTPDLVKARLKCDTRTWNLKTNKAIKIGSRVDQLIRDSEKPKKSDVDEVKNCMNAWFKWRERYPEEITFPETAYDDKRRIAGTPDFYMTKSRILVDIKTSMRVYNNYWLQVGGCYSSLPFDFVIDDVAILRLDKPSGDYEFVTASSLNLDIDILRMGFNGLINFYRVSDYIEFKTTKTEREDNHE